MAPFQTGETLYALNPKYRDGTRLRAAPGADAAFNGVWVPNDTRLEVIEVSDGFALVRKPDGQRGWIRQRNLTRTERVPGVAKGVVTTEMVTPDPEYVRGIRIYNLGIKEDPVPGDKRGKGSQHLLSPQWLNALSEFVAAHLPQLAAFARHARDASASHPGYDYVYFTNTAEHLFNRADALGLRTAEARELLLMATWLVMAAAEVDDFPFSKYTPADRAGQRAAFYAATLDPRPGPGTVPALRDDAGVLGRFAAPASRRDLLPPIAMERLGINNELSALKYADAAQPLREGFALSTRVDSVRRHLEGVHRRLVDEDHVVHLLWNLHAIYHVLVVFPERNDLVDYAPRPEPRRETYRPATSLERIAALGRPVDEVLKLDWNEGTIPPPPSVSEALVAYVRAAGGAALKWYPHLGGGALRAAIAGYCGGIEENVLVTNGSDEALVLVCRTLLGPGARALAVVPTYEHFCADALATGAELIRLPLPDPFAADAQTVAAGIEQHRPALVYLVSPSNPTGIEWGPEVVRGLAARFPAVTFLVDEAYHEFGTVDEATGAPSTCASLAFEHQNVIVTRTFSKAFCLAALRCGYALAHPNTIERLRALDNPKSVNQLAQIAAQRALDELDTHYRPYAARTREARASFVQALSARGVAVRSGGAGNFVCVAVPDGRTAELCQRLEADAIFVRDLSGRFPGHVRVTIGLEMERVVDAITEALRGMGLL